MELSKKELIKRLDRLTSVLVRLRDKRCVTCGRPLMFKQREAGHYIPREVMETRWDFFNVHTQCHICNVAKGGNLTTYRRHIIRLYGPETHERLQAALKRYQTATSIPITQETMTTIYNDLLTRVRREEQDQRREFIPKSWKCYTEKD